MVHYPLVTVVGGSGFVGRHTVKLLAHSGYRVRVLSRDAVEAAFLKTQATVGEIAVEFADITRPATLAGKFPGSDAVVNLVSIMHESGRQKFRTINIDGARAIAQEAAHAGVGSLVHISALGVDRARDTQYGSTKLAGEEAVRAAFPNATILRPSLIAGPEDKFFQRFARMATFMPGLPVIGGGKTKFQPVLVGDVAAAILACVQRDDARGQTYELGGATTYSFLELMRLIVRVINRNPYLVPMPTAMASLQGLLCEILPFAPIITRDQVKLLAHDNVVAPAAKTFADLGIVPGDVEAALPGLLARYVKQA